MVAVLPHIEPDGLYSPKETWQILGISKSALYDYDSRGLLEHEIRRSNGKRVYRGRAIMRFHGVTL